jgi:hypothetical protein
VGMDSITNRGDIAARKLAIGSVPAGCTVGLNHGRHI